MTRQRERLPKIRSARSTATEPTETEPRVMLVRVRTSLATLNARWKSLLRWREVLPARRPPAVAPSIVPLRTAPHPQDFACVVLASGLLPDWSWLGDPVPGAHGTIAQHRGATEVPGLYVVGQHFQHRRDSTYIDGARHNARDVVGHLLAEAPPVVTS